MDETKKVLDDMINTGMEQLGDMEPGTEKYKIQVDCITKCVDRKTDIEKFEVDCETKDVDNTFRRKQAKKENIDRWVKNGLTAVGVIGSLVVTVWGANKWGWYEEEKDEIVTSGPGKEFMKQLFKHK